MSSSPIQATSRTYLTAMADINSDPLLVDKPEWFKRLIAGAVDISSIMVNAEANNGYLRTSLTRRAVTDLCNLIDYSPVPQVAASGTMMFDLNPATVMPYTVLQPNLAANGPSSFGQSALRFGTRTSLAFNTLTEVLLPAAFNTTNGQVTIGTPTSTWYIGEKIRFSSTLTLPTGISANTDYFVSGINLTSLWITVTTTRTLAIAGNVLVPSTQGTGTITGTRLSLAVTAYQETDVASFSPGSSDGVTPFQEFDIAQVGVLSDSLAVTVLGQAYTLVTTLALSAPTDKVFRVYYNTDGTATLKFGNGVYGVIPPAAPVYVSYSWGGGSISNVTYLNQVTAYAGGDALNVSGCFNATAFTGGGDPETLDSAKANAPMLLKARSRFITISDGIALATSLGGVSLVGINKNTYGVLSCQVLAIATGGGNASPAQQAAMATYLTNLSPMSAINVHVDNATLTPVVIAENVHISPGFTQTSVFSYVDIANRIFFSEAGTEICSAFTSGGITLAVSRINAIFSKSFASADYAALTAILQTLILLAPRNFGDLIELSDLYGLLAVIPGVGYVITTSCGLTNFLTSGYAAAANEITTMTGGSVTLTAV